MLLELHYLLHQHPVEPREQTLERPNRHPSSFRPPGQYLDGVAEELERLETLAATLIDGAPWSTLAASQQEEDGSTYKSRSVGL